jgi:hypothetical protein
MHQTTNPLLKVSHLKHEGGGSNKHGARSTDDLDGRASELRRLGC